MHPIGRFEWLDALIRRTLFLSPSSISPWSNAGFIPYLGFLRRNFHLVEFIMN